MARADYEEVYGTAPDAPAPEPQAFAAAPATASGPLLSGGDFEIVHDKNLDKGVKRNIQWGLVQYEGWTGKKDKEWGHEIEIQYNKKTGRKYAELSAHKGNSGIRQVIDLAPGTYFLTWEHAPRKSKKAGDNAYKLNVFTHADVLLNPALHLRLAAAHPHRMDPRRRRLHRTAFAWFRPHDPRRHPV